MYCTSASSIRITKRYSQNTEIYLALGAKGKVEEDAYLRAHGAEGDIVVQQSEIGYKRSIHIGNEVYVYSQRYQCVL